MLLQLKKTINANFNELALASFDELNVVQCAVRTQKMFDRMMENNRKCLLKIAEQEHEDIIDELVDAGYVLGENAFPISDWVDAYLASYNPVSHYLYAPEAERKRLRMDEEIQTARELRDRQMMRESINRSKSLWWNQTQVYMVDVVDAVRLDAMKQAGVERVMWHCNDDEKTCGTCWDRDLEIYDINKIPVKHRLCRCWVTPIRS